MQDAPQQPYWQDVPPEYPTWLYAAVHSGNPGDLEHYLKHCTGAGPVLELGCGTGRIAGPLTAAGESVIGIDRDPEAVGVARAVGVDARVADLRDFDLGRRFRRIIAPYNVLYCLLTEYELRACLGRVRAHLAPNGEFLFDVYCADAMHFALDLTSIAPDAAPLEEGDPDPIMSVTARERAWDIYEDSLWWPSQQRIDARFRHVPRDGGDSVGAMIPQRYLLSGELSGLLATAGLGVRAWHGGFDGASFDNDSELMVLRTAFLDQ